MNKRFYIFDEYRLDTQNHRLRRAGETVALTPKEFEVLFALVEKAGDVVGKDALLDAVWKDVSVAEETLTRNISWLRKKLGGNFIETVSKRGYRFTAAVTTSDAPEIIVEEQTLTRVRVEETWSLAELSDGEGERERRGEGERQIAASPTLSPSRRVRAAPLLFAGGLLALAAVGFIVYQNFFRQAAPKIVFAGRVVPFAGLPGLEGMPAFSPDSKQIVFGWNGGEGEILDIYVKIIGAGEPVRLTRGATNAFFPVFAPDGQSVAFFRSSPETSKIFSVSALGGAERKICDAQSGGTSFSFAPDGQTIATADRDATGANGIFLVNVATGAKTRLTAPSANFTDSKPRYAPDGKSLVFVRSSGWENQDLYIVATAGGAARRLTLDGSRLFGAAWSADGGSVIFSSARGASSVNLWQIAAAGGAPELLLTGGKNPTTPVVAPDGKSIAFVEEAQDANIWHYETNDAGKQNPPRKLIASTRADHSPNLSLDGGRVVFVSNRTGDNAVWTAAADGANPLQLANGNSPRLSPDGKLVVFVASVANRDALHLVSVEGGAPRVLVADAAQNNLPTWSADGRAIYFRSNRGGEFNLWKIAADGGGAAAQITKQGAYESYAAPDGNTIYYTQNRESAGLWRVSANAGAETSDETAVPELAEAGFRRSWTITQRGVYFVVQAAQPPYKLRFFDFSTRQSKEIATIDKAPILDSPGLSVAQDGKSFLYAQYDQNAGSIMLAELGR